MKIIVSILCTFLMAASLQAQPSISLQEAIAMAKNRYPALKASRLHTQSTLAMQRTARDFGNLELSMGGEEIGRGNDAVTTLLAARQNLDIFFRSKPAGNACSKKHVWLMLRPACLNNSCNCK